MIFLGVKQRNAAGKLQQIEGIGAQMRGKRCVLILILQDIELILQ